MTTDSPHSPGSRPIRNAASFFLFALVALSPWPFGSVTPAGRLAVSLAILALVGCWCFHALRTRRLTAHPDAITICLLGLVLLTAAQLVPLPVSVVRLLSPTAAEWHNSLIPETAELLPGESEASASRRSNWIRLSTAPAGTEDLLASLLAVFLVYAVTRNFVAPASGEGLRRLAWVAFALGISLALLGFAQALSGDCSRIYWRMEVYGRPFGPFANKNHFAFQLNLCMGLASGLFIAVAKRPGGWRSPAGLGLLGGLGLMAAAVAFSQSRGGLLATLAAGVVMGIVAFRNRDREKPGELRAGLLLALAVAVIAGGLVSWLGWRQVTQRIATLWDGNADNRTEDWRSVWPLVARFPLVGVGGGGLIWTEPTVRTRSELGYSFNTLDNEYLEALVEGGIVRLSLTLGLAVSAVWLCVRGFRRIGDPLLLGCAFGLLAVAVQSLGDFGLHVPSVAIIAAVIAGYATAPRHLAPEYVFTGPARYAAVGLLLLAAFAVVLTEWRNHRVATHRAAAALLLASGSPEQRTQGIRVLKAATRIRPNDPLAWEQLMFSHLAEAGERQRNAIAGVVGGIAFVDPVDFTPSGNEDEHIAAALRTARGLRACQPLAPAAHMALGMYANQFTRSEASTVHFDRVKHVANFDADVWYLSGKAASLRGDWQSAIADWRVSLSKSRKRLPLIAWRAACHFSPEELRSRLLPDDPEIWLVATPFVFRESTAEGRREWLKAIATRWDSSSEPMQLSGFTSWAAVHSELRDEQNELRVWRRAVERFPEEVLPRDRLAARLESLELYEQAVPLLEWLLAREPNRGEFGERLAAARHALKLKANIDDPGR